MKKTLIIIFALAALFAAVFGAYYFTHSHEKADPAPSEPAAPSPELTEEVLPPTLCPGLEQLLSEAGISPEALVGTQLIVVKASGSNAAVSCFEIVENAWTQTCPDCEAHVGRNGVSSCKREGDLTTPAGLYPLGTAFGTEASPETELDYRQITPDSYWVDDPASQYYNRWVEGTESMDWSHAEHLADYPSAYALSVVIEYNSSPVVPGAGSAIFLHCGESSTVGCVAVPHEKMVEILGWLSPEKQPMILIFGE